MFFIISTGFGFRVNKKYNKGNNNYEDLLPVLGVSPLFYDYGMHDTGTNTDYIFTLTNTGNEVAEDITVAVSGTGFSLLSSAGPFNVAANGGTANVTVRFSPQSGSTLSGSLTFSWPNRDDIVVGLSGFNLHTPTPTTYSTVTQKDSNATLGSTNNTGILGQLITSSVVHNLCEASFSIYSITGDVSSKIYYIKVYSRSGTSLGTLKGTSSPISNITNTGIVSGTFNTPVQIVTGDVICIVAPSADASNYIQLDQALSDKDGSYSNLVGYNLTGLYEISNYASRDLNYIFKELL
jgi:hypothetical protein